MSTKRKLHLNVVIGYSNLKATQYFSKLSQASIEVLIKDLNELKLPLPSRKCIDQVSHGILKFWWPEAMEGGTLHSQLEERINGRKRDNKLLKALDISSLSLRARVVGTTTAGIKRPHPESVAVNHGASTTSIPSYRQPPPQTRQVQSKPPPKPIVAAPARVPKVELRDEAQDFLNTPMTMDIIRGIKRRKIDTGANAAENVNATPGIPIPFESPSTNTPLVHTVPYASPYLPTIDGAEEYTPLNPWVATPSWSGPLGGNFTWPPPPLPPPPAPAPAMPPNASSPGLTSVSAQDVVNLVRTIKEGSAAQAASLYQQMSRSGAGSASSLPASASSGVQQPPSKTSWSSAVPRAPTILRPAHPTSHPLPARPGFASASQSLPLKPEFGTSSQPFSVTSTSGTANILRVDWSVPTSTTTPTLIHPAPASQPISRPLPVKPASRSILDPKPTAGPSAVGNVSTTHSSTSPSLPGSVSAFGLRRTSFSGTPILGYAVSKAEEQEQEGGESEEEEQARIHTVEEHTEEEEVQRDEEHEEERMSEASWTSAHDRILKGGTASGLTTPYSYHPRTSDEEEEEEMLQQTQKQKQKQKQAVRQEEEEMCLYSPLSPPLRTSSRKESSKNINASRKAVAYGASEEEGEEHEEEEEENQQHEEDEDHFYSSPASESSKSFKASRKTVCGYGDGTTDDEGAEEEERRRQEKQHEEGEEEIYTSPAPEPLMSVNASHNDAYGNGNGTTDEEAGEEEEEEEKEHQQQEGYQREEERQREEEQYEEEEEDTYLSPVPEPLKSVNTLHKAAYGYDDRTTDEDGEEGHTAYVPKPQASAKVEGEEPDPCGIRSYEEARVSDYRAIGMTRGGISDEEARVSYYKFKALIDARDTRSSEGQEVGLDGPSWDASRVSSHEEPLESITATREAALYTDSSASPAAAREVVVKQEPLASPTMYSDLLKSITASREEVVTSPSEGPSSPDGGRAGSNTSLSPSIRPSQRSSVMDLGKERDDVQIDVETPSSDSVPSSISTSVTSFEAQSSKRSTASAPVRTESHEDREEPVVEHLSYMDTEEFLRDELQILRDEIKSSRGQEIRLYNKLLQLNASDIEPPPIDNASLQKELDEAKKQLEEERGCRLEAVDEVKKQLDEERRLRMEAVEEAKKQLEEERRLRVEAEQSLADVRRECKTPFIVPALFDAFVKVSRLTPKATGAQPDA